MSIIDKLAVYQSRGQDVPMSVSQKYVELTGAVTWVDNDQIYDCRDCKEVPKKMTACQGARFLKHVIFVHPYPLHCKQGNCGAREDSGTANGPAQPRLQGLHLSEHSMSNNIGGDKSLPSSVRSHSATCFRVTINYTPIGNYNLRCSSRAVRLNSMQVMLANLRGAWERQSVLFYTSFVIGSTTSSFLNSKGMLRPIQLLNRAQLLSDYLR